MCKDILEITKILLIQRAYLVKMLRALSLTVSFMISELKRRGVNKYCSSPNVQDTVKADSTEWEVLYTAQLTQKAKKFHDGILKIANSGLCGRQAFLYDGTRKLLESRFLRTDEKIDVGESLRFDGHIMDILEPKDNKPLKDTNIDRNDCYTQSTVQSKIRDEHLADFKKCETSKSSISASCPYTTKTNLTEKPPKRASSLQDIGSKAKSSVADKVIPATISNNKPLCDEWDVMYTTQVTQKAKKYHDGFLKLSSCGSLGRKEVTLLADDGMILSHRYLKLSEDISWGSLFNMTNYLVEVGEPRKSSEGGCPKKASISESETSETRTFDVDDIKLCKRMPATEPLSDGKAIKRALPLQDTDSKVKNSVADNVIATTISKNKPLRDAHSILSFLKKPSAQDGVMEKVNVKEIHHPSQVSACVQAGIQYQVEWHPDSCSKRSEEAVCNEETRAANVGGHPEAMSSEATSTSSFNELDKETKDQSNTEISGDNRTIDSSVHDVSIDTKKGFKKTDSRNDEFPSFDLGID